MAIIFLLAGLPIFIRGLFLVGIQLKEYIENIKRMSALHSAYSEKVPRDKSDNFFRFPAIWLTTPVGGSNIKYGSDHPLHL